MAGGQRKKRTGKVISDKMNKTRVVEVVISLRHHLYEKVMRHKKHYYAHDENNESKLGDRVLIAETRPLSKLKRWRVVKILVKAGRAGPSET
ncbi:MAG: 30S ribosomal protein S17 [Elusimicrobia bacterium]|nr:30S ribosomal protein S17 [Elusimicrobiota bacterium]